MILPGKHLRADRALLTVGGEILSVMGQECTVSDAWEKVKSVRAERKDASPLPFDWFLLALTLLYAMGAVDMRHGVLVPRVAA